MHFPQRRAIHQVVVGEHITSAGLHARARQADRDSFARQVHHRGNLSLGGGLVEQFPAYDHVYHVMVQGRDDRQTVERHGAALNDGHVDVAISQSLVVFLRSRGGNHFGGVTGTAIERLGDTQTFLVVQAAFDSGADANHWRQRVAHEEPGGQRHHQYQRHQPGEPPAEQTRERLGHIASIPERRAGEPRFSVDYSLGGAWMRIFQHHW